MNTRGRGSQFQEFRCRAYRANRALWWAPTSEPTRNFIPFNYKDVLSFLITLNQHLSVIQPLFLLTSVV